MAITTYAAIDVGSGEIAMKIFEISKKHGIVELTHLRHKLSLGAEIFANKHISYKTISEICKVLKDYRNIMNEYQVSTRHAYGTDTLYEASNWMTLLDQVKQHSGIWIDILSNSVERFLCYKALFLLEKDCSQMLQENALIIDIGAGSVQFSLFCHGELEFSQKLKLGSSRISELMHTMEAEIFSFDDLVSEYIDKDLNTMWRFFLKDKKVRHIIAVGSKIPEIKQYITEKHPSFNGLISKKEFSKVKAPANLSVSQSEMLISSLLLCKKVAVLTQCDDIYLSSVDLCDCMGSNYAEGKISSHSSRDFTKDIINVAKKTAVHYHANMDHVENVSYLATEIFDSIRKLHGMGKRERLLLQLGVILHTCGAYIGIGDSRENSYRIVMSTEIIGISPKERAIVANIIRYNSESFPSYEELSDDISGDEYITIVKLCAILKLANVMDKSNTQKIKQVGVTLKDKSLQIVAHTMEDITLERGLFRHRADIFEEAFGVRPVLKRRK